MADDLLADATACLDLLRRELDGSRLEWSEDVAHAPLALALLSRMVYLCESAIELARTCHKSAAAVLLRPAIECWIDCCYVLYCKVEAVAQLTVLGLREREKLARIWLGGDPTPDIAVQVDELNSVVASGQTAGALDPDFKLRSSMPVEVRLKAAIKGRGAALSYLDIYDYLYRMLSLGEMHTSSALEFHGEFDDNAFRSRVTPIATFDVDAFISIAVLLACGAAVDAFALLGIDPSELAAVSAPLNVKLGSVLAAMREDLVSSTQPETQRALAVLQKRGEA